MPPRATKKKANANAKAKAKAKATTKPTSSFPQGPFVRRAPPYVVSKQQHLAAVHLFCSKS